MAVDAHRVYSWWRAQTLKHGLKNNMMLKIGTDGSFHMSLETASFGWLLIGNKNVLVQDAGLVDWVPSVLVQQEQNCLGLQLQMSFFSTLCSSIRSNQQASARSVWTTRRQYHV
jgi:hypothetical protein